MKRNVWFVLITFFVVACSPMSKESYMERYADFVNEVGQNASNYNEKEWARQDEMCDKYTNEWYEKFEAELTTSEKLRIASYEVKYYYYRGLIKSKNWLENNINSIDLKSSISTLKLFGDEFINSIDQLDEEAAKLDESFYGLLNQINIMLDQPSDSGR